MLNYVHYYVKLCDVSTFSHCIDDIMLEWYLLSLLMITIVFLFHFRGEFEFEFEFELKLECELGFGFGFEYIWIWNGKECEHVGSVDFVGPATRCQCYQPQWLFLIAVIYSIKL